ncbi:MAG: Gfo/Idh/MocA family protein [Luteibaculaceae bacterium]
MVKIGVLGAGHLGKIHIQQILEVPALSLVGIYDPSPKNAQEAAEKYGVAIFDNLDELIDAVDAVDIVTPTLSHFECAVKAIRKGKHIFIEKPITNTVEEAKKLVNLVDEANIVAQVGHVERFNPAFTAARDSIQNPMFVETHRLAQFNPRGTDVSVVLDLMIHDIDIVLSIVKSNIKRISASGVAVVSETPDISNARIEFDNGCVANLTASRISLKNMRKTRIFQKNAYISVDFLEKSVERVQLEDVVGEPDPFAVVLDLGENRGQKAIKINAPKVEPVNAIREELSSFAHSILNNVPPRVSAEEGMRALMVAHQVLDKMRLNLAAID